MKSTIFGMQRLNFPQNSTEIQSTILRAAFVCKIDYIHCTFLPNQCLNNKRNYPN